MESMARASDKALCWTQVAPRVYELRVDLQRFARLEWVTPVGSLATGTAADGHWTIKRMGFLRPRITVRLADQEPNLAIWSSIARGQSLLAFRDGRSFLWRATRRRHGERGFFDGRGVRVISFRPLTKKVRCQGLVEIGAGQEKRTELPLLAILGWYLLVLEHDDDEAAAAAAAGGALSAAM
jgi:hypothetical protein